jgi:galactokinase
VDKAAGLAVGGARRHNFAMETAAERAADAFEWAYGTKPEVTARAPGRINLIGEHVDYNDGFVLPAAIDLDVVVAASPRHDRRVRLIAADLDESASFNLDVPGARRTTWASYVQGVAVLTESVGVRLTGADLAIAGDVPRGAGLSSSAAFEVAIARALLAVCGRNLPDMEIVEICHRAEREFAGVSCGVMDQFAAVFGRERHALFLDCRSLHCAPVRMPSDVVLIATDSGTRRSLGLTAYNDRVEQCQEAARLLGVRRLRDIRLDQLESRTGRLPELLARRVRHVVSEIERTREAATALEAGETANVGRFMNESHASLRDDYDVSTPQLDALVALAQALPGVHGSRMSGAGFGGCTVSLVAAEAADAFREQIPEAYRSETGQEATVYVLQPAAGASVINGIEM